MKYNFNQNLEETEKKYNIGGDDKYKFEEGENRIRVLSPGEPTASHFQNKKFLGTCYGVEKGCPFHIGQYKDTLSRVKFLMYIIDRKDNQIKLANMPYIIIKAIGALQENQDYAFDEIPMPYDITINAKGAGKIEVEYTVIPSPKLIPLTQEEQNELLKLKSVKEIVERMKEKQKEKIDNDPQFAGESEVQERLVNNEKNVEGMKKDINYPEEEAINAEQIPW